MRRRNNNLVIWLLVFVIIIMAIIIGLMAFDVISFNNGDNNTNQTIVDNEDSFKKENISKENISEEVLKEVIDKELFILFRENEVITKLEDIDNKSKLLVALSILEEEYIVRSNEISTTIVNVEKEKLESAFNSSVISNLGIKHEDFDIYKLTGDSVYNRETDLLVYSTESFKYLFPRASKVKSYAKKGEQYIISMNYLFPDDRVGFEYYYSNIDDIKTKTNSIVKAYNENNEYIDAQEYLDNNYDSIKDKLATYTYVFEFKDEKLVLDSFSIN